MIEFLQLPEERRRAFIAQAAVETGMTEKAVEKDWWVTLVLRAIFTLPISDVTGNYNYTVFGNVDYIGIGNNGYRVFGNNEYRKKGNKIAGFKDKISWFDLQINIPDKADH